MTLTGENTGRDVGPDYHELNADTEAQLISDMLSANAELRDSEAPYAMVTLDGHSPYANVARSLERKQFESHFGNTAEDMAKEYEAYENSSVFFLMVDQKELKPTGVMRLIKPNPNGFKSVNDIASSKSMTSEGTLATNLSVDEVLPSMGIDSSMTLDVATIAAHPDYTEKATGSPIVLATLMRAVYKYALDNGYDDLVAIIDEKPLAQLEKVALPIATSSDIATPFEYLGALGNSFVDISIPQVKESVSALDPMVFDYVFGDLALGGECQLSFAKQ